MVVAPFDGGEPRRFDGVPRSRVKVCDESWSVREIIRAHMRERSVAVGVGDS